MSAKDAGPGPKTTPRKRIAKGPPRPHYLESPDLDRMMIMLVALVSEVLAVRDRLDTHEELLDAKGVLPKTDVEAFRPTPQLEDMREEQRLRVMRRVFRVLRDEFETYSDEDAGQDPAAVKAAETVG